MIKKVNKKGKKKKKDGDERRENGKNRNL